MLIVTDTHPCLKGREVLAAVRGEALFIIYHIFYWFFSLLLIFLLECDVNTPAATLLTHNDQRGGDFTTLTLHQQESAIISVRIKQTDLQF